MTLWKCETKAKDTRITQKDGAAIYSQGQLRRSKSGWKGYEFESINSKFSVSTTEYESQGRWDEARDLRSCVWMISKSRDWKELPSSGK